MAYGLKQATFLRESVLAKFERGMMAQMQLQRITCPPTLEVLKR